MKINDNFLKLESSYLFSSIAKKVAAYQQAHPEADVIRLGIGDVTRPLAPAVIEAMHKAVDEMADEKTFRGYPPEYGYDFLLKAIQENDYAARGVQIGTDEIFVSDGAKSDCGNIGDILDAGNRVAVCDPIYPVMWTQILWPAAAATKCRTADSAISSTCPARRKTALCPTCPPRCRT